MLGYAAVQPNRFDVRLQARQSQGQNFLRRIGHWKQLSRGLVHAHIGRLCTQQHSCQEFKHTGIFQLGIGLWIRRFQRRKKWFDVLFFQNITRK